MEVIKPSLNNIKGDFLLGNEENLFAMVKEVRDHVGDGLGFASAWRAIKDEGFAFLSINDGFDLA